MDAAVGSASRTFPTARGRDQTRSAQNPENPKNKKYFPRYSLKNAVSRKCAALLSAKTCSASRNTEALMNNRPTTRSAPRPACPIPPRHRSPIGFVFKKRTQTNPFFMRPIPSSSSKTPFHSQRTQNHLRSTRTHFHPRRKCWQTRRTGHFNIDWRIAT